MNLWCWVWNLGPCPWEASTLPLNYTPLEDEFRLMLHSWAEGVAQAIEGLPEFLLQGYTHKTLLF
jgi:hypothetical protein